MAELKMKILPSTEKCFLDDKIEDKPALSEVSMLKNERLSFQLAHTWIDESNNLRQHYKMTIDSPLENDITVTKIEPVPVTLPCYPIARDENYLRTEPGLFPDLLLPFDYTDLPVVSPNKQLRAHLFTIENKDGIEPGEYTITIRLTVGESVNTASLKVTVIDAMLPESELIHTQWFHNDCIATYYRCDVFSERHWELIGNYMEAAVNCGVNMILTPVMTPPLDTAVGRSRPTVQLIDIDVKDGEYTFGYDKLDRYVKLALSKGIRYFEISHLFSQWGASKAPKVMATVDGEYKQLFGWDTESTGAEYTKFIREFTSGLVARLKLLGVDKRCYFHISDEPGLEHLENYTKAKNLIADIIEDYTCMDALSKYEFYETGAVQCPIPATNHIGPFLENKVPDLWTYYCCGQTVNVSNRFLAMPGQRTRILGYQLFKFDIKGFLQWGFNFWYSQGSIHPLDPYTDTCGDYFSPAGDCFSVYPGEDGKARYSLHAVHFYEALQDLRALKLLESKIGHDAVVALIEEGCDAPMTFASYPTSQEYLLTLREKINAEIAKNI